jgi:hypothetical protein
LRTANKSMRRDKPKQSIPNHTNPIPWVQNTRIGSREKTRYIMPSTTISHRNKSNGKTSSKTRIIPTTGSKTKPIDGMPKTYSHCQRTRGQSSEDRGQMTENRRSSLHPSSAPETLLVPTLKP